jgi:lipopolysaccharide/colanic/teichoic acid biosynthesis glycosyltransferase
VAVKRALDIFVALFALILFAVPMLLIAVAIRLTMGGPVLFRQRRPGWKRRIFTLVKFRTMTTGSGPDEARLTPLGRLLRRTSLDELPELWNVLKGDMSLVGPRPLLEEYLPLYTPEQDRRHEARPGITGWAVVKGRNALTWEEKFKLDTWYVDHRSFGLDLKILLLTLLQATRQEGVHAAGHATMPKFRGSR